ncbi:MAG: 23S rRNA (guanosine(2251)-2'-O)-methyltransferase RlmB [Clostridium sp.]|uniref:23S rRNA (guanosine(2251)-2'-O)-methyltransferase RlmB n=1 Tax=Clostridium sp. TaxID=1506 RepID=UPI00399B6C10
MTKRESQRRREREFNKFQERNNKFQDRRDDRKEKNNTSNESMREDLIIGRNAVIEALKSDRTIECVYVSKGDLEGSIKVALGLAKDRGVVIKEADRRKLDTMCDGLNHQGIVARVTPFKYCEVNDILEDAKRKEQQPFIVILDEIEDPHNLGSIIRTAELCGVHGIIIPKRRNVGVTSTVYKCSAGAIEHMKIAKVTNINATIDMLKEQGIWIYGADIDGKDYSYNTDFSGPCALIIGSEGKGISNLTLKKCDLLVKIPMIGKINSLNASVAGGIMMYEVLKGRLTK